MEWSVGDSPRCLKVVSFHPIPAQRHWAVFLQVDTRRGCRKEFVRDVPRTLLLFGWVAPSSAKLMRVAGPGFSLVAEGLTH